MPENSNFETVAPFLKFIFTQNAADLISQDPQSPLTDMIDGFYDLDSIKIRCENDNDLLGIGFLFMPDAEYAITRNTVLAMLGGDPTQPTNFPTKSEFAQAIANVYSHIYLEFHHVTAEGIASANLSESMQQFHAMPVGILLSEDTLYESYDVTAVVADMMASAFSANTPSPPGEENEPIHLN